MAGPWEQYASPVVEQQERKRPYIEITPTEPKAKPWEQYQSKPWEKFARDLPVVPGISLGNVMDMPSEYTRIRHEGQERMSRGVEQMGTPGSRMGGAFNTLMGATQFTASPIEAAVHSVVGKPITEATGSEKAGQYGDFAAGLAIPGYGLTRASPVIRTFDTFLSPEKMGPVAEHAASTVRAGSGQAERSIAQTEAAVEGFRAQVNAAPDAIKMDIVHAMETPGGQLPGPLAQFQPLADTMRDAFKQRRTKLERMYPTMNFIEDYFPHFWKDPAAAQAFARQWSGGAARQGSGASLKARTVPTYADGLRAGLEPLTKDPIEATLRYVRSMDHFIASHEMLEAGKASGYVRYIRPKVVGASGHPESFKVPDGYVPLNGRGAVRGDGAKAYAPADWARIYNRYIDPGWFKEHDFGPLMGRLQRTSNGITAMELGLSAYHATTMAKEAVISEFSRGMSQLFTPGQRLKAIGTIPTSFAAPVMSYMKGRKALEVYLGRSPGTGDFRRTMDLLTEAGGRATGARHAPEYQFSAMDNFWTAWKRGALKQQMAESVANVKARPVVGTAVEVPRLIGRAMSTIAYPIFNQYIPRLKTGAFYDHMRTWLEANPAATHEQQVQIAKKIWDSIDNRFGEMVQDNIFWNKTMKQVATLGMRSYSWNMGTVREIGGGALSALKDPRRLSMASKDYDPRVAYVIAMPMVTAIVNATYQYLKTGKAPEDPRDLIAPQTGGTAPGFAGKGEVPERAMTPGYEKDVLGWYNDWEQEAINKTARAPSLVLELARNKDWRGDPIANLQGPSDQRLSQYFQHVLDSVTPISAKALLQGGKTGSNIGTMERLMGVRPATTYLQDPEGYERGMAAIKRRAQKTKERHDRRTQQQYGGPNE